MRRWLGLVVALAACRGRVAEPPQPSWYVEVAVERDQISVARVPSGELDVLAGYDWPALEALLARLRPTGMTVHAEIAFAVDDIIYRDMMRGIEAVEDAGYDAAVSTWWFDLARHTRAQDGCAPGTPAIVHAIGPCEYAWHGDVDGDGVDDCWRVRHPGDDTAVIAVRPGCRGDEVALVARERGITDIELPATLATPRWQRGIAELFVGAEQVSDGGVSMTSAWRWWRATRSRGDGAALHGASPVSWEPLDSRSARPNALAIAGEPRIVVDAATRGDGRSVECDNAVVVVVRGGIAAYDQQRAQLRWIYRGRGALDVTGLACDEGVLLVQGEHAAVAVDLASGSWLDEPGAHVFTLGWAPNRWQRADGTLIAIRTLAAWLRRPLASRGLLDDQRMMRPELDLDPHALAVSRLALDAPLPASFPARALPVGADAELDSGFECGGWTIRASDNALLAVRGRRARWLAVEPEGSTHALASASCDGDQIEVKRVGSELGQYLDEHLMRIDLRRGVRSVN